MKKAIEDTHKLHGEVLNVEKELELFGKREAEQAAMRVQWAGEDADKALKSLLDAEAKVKDINAQIAEAKRGAGAFAAGAGSAYEGTLTAAKAKVNELREAWKLAEGQALLAQKRAAEAAVTQVQQVGTRIKEVLFPIFGTGQQQGTFAVAIDGMTKAIDVDVKSINLWVNSLQPVPLIFSEVDRQLAQTNNLLGEGAVRFSRYAVAA